ncbi:hypothetical protein OG439_46210 [Amycolatopsis sp. NBC_01307]|uniref:hypothetical protein n=1 Tax=Amycolatopsis sp. NBC_01307 TaxID=2903561 RepID=UPI002E0D5752|nr:hypothetical protein OG439_46210 [Amycolatopsis sp. NBC_01307]
MIRKQDLGPMDYIASGAIGDVHGLTAFSLPGHPELAFKEIKPVGGAVTASARAQALDSIVKMVAFRAGLNQADRDDLDEYTTWPLDVVEDRGQPCGMVMPLIPADFFTTTTPQNGKPGKLVMELQWLSTKDALVRRLGIDRSGFQDRLTRIALTAQLVYAVGRLHKHGLVYGDLSLKNAAVALNPLRVKLLDCDAAASLTDPQRKQMHSPSFNPPEMSTGTKLQDDVTDVYKLGLCVIRCLAQGAGITQAKDPAILTATLDQPAIDVIARAVGVDRARRPDARELFDCLERNLLAKASPPVLRAAWLDRDTTIRGQDIQVSWNSTGAKEVVINGANGLRTTVPDQGTPTGTCTVTPLASGPIHVEVVNSHGSIRMLAGNATLYELPPFRVDLTGLPRPAVPGMSPVRIPPVLHALPAVPQVGTAAHPVPRVEFPSLDAVADAVSSVRTGPPPMDRVAAALTGASGPAPGSRWAHLAAAPGPNLAAAAGSTASGVHQALVDAREQLRDRVAAEVATAMRQGSPRP